MKLFKIIIIIFTISSNILFSQLFSDSIIAKVKVKNLSSLNSEKDDYSSFITPNGKWLYFTSSRENNSDIYKCQINSDSIDLPQKVNDQNVNSSIKDDGSFTTKTSKFSMLFEGFNDLKNIKLSDTAFVVRSKRTIGSGDADIYTCNINVDGSSIVNVVPFSIINSSGWDSQPTISADGNTIVFTSIRKMKTYGGMDLFIIKKNSDGTFSNPVNIGKPINTSGDEFSPFLSPDGRTLYFSSNGHKGFGKSDIYVSFIDDNGAWTKPKNLGNKINTSSNDCFFYGVGLNKFYFSSDREDSSSKGGLDLYEGTTNVFASGYTLLKPMCFDTVFNKPLNANLKFYEQTTNKLIATCKYDTTQDVGVLLVTYFNYRVEMESKGYRKRETLISNLKFNETETHRFNFGNPPPEPPPATEIIFDPKGTPMYASGYYRPLTFTSLEDLRQRQNKGNLKGITYIADVSNSDTNRYDFYREYTRKIEKTLDSLTKDLSEKYFTRYLRYLDSTKANEKIQITVVGFADPRPINGRYIENEIKFLDLSGNEVTVKTNDSLDNFKLSGLRAYFAVETMKLKFSQYGSFDKNVYNELEKRGIIEWRAMSGNISPEEVNNNQNNNSLFTSPETDLGTRRRFKVIIQRRFLTE
ncbi:MAG: PD40 domain-containing protein [Chlorobiota bacterium]|nr:PD40 domain-containing protein [Chlorobiota bacterium]QQS65475.1 MAG: PD40 domain-containing protein [Chlorobiota bacterium]